MGCRSQERLRKLLVVTQWASAARVKFTARAVWFQSSTYCSSVGGVWLWIIGTLSMPFQCNRADCLFPNWNSKLFLNSKESKAFLFPPQIVSWRIKDGCLIISSGPISWKRMLLLNEFGHHSVFSNCHTFFWNHAVDNKKIHRHVFLRAYHHFPMNL